VRLPAPLTTKIKHWTTLSRTVEAIAPRVSMLIAEISHGELAPLVSLTPGRTLGVGSTFKLYVLGELVRQIDAGIAGWSEELPIRDDLRSLPNGDMRLEPAGARFPLTHYAEQMIAASDNTATDHLIQRLGRENVEAMFADFGQTIPERNMPLLLTREWFAIKLRMSPDAVADFLNEPVDGRRAFLETNVDPLAASLTEDEVWLEPRYIEQIEWFASAGDLARAMLRLHTLALRPGSARIHDLLSSNPGIPFDARTWAYVGYKGGYETGVKSDVWLLQRGDGRWFTIAVIINDERKETDGVGLWQLMLPATTLLAAVR
jgi:beta-lactamase class A